jgi:PAS domain S-box-containing protein
MANVHPQDRDRLAATLEKAAWSGEPFELTCRLHRPDDGCERVVRVGGRAERPGRLLGTVIDVTDQVESERRLARAQEIAHLGSWDWNIVTGDLSWSDEIYRIFGLEPQQFRPTYGTFLERVHPDDRAAVKQAVADAIEARTPYGIEHRVVRPDGEERIVHEQGEVTYTPDGTPLQMIGTVLDITERARPLQEDAGPDARLRLHVQARHAALLLRQPRGRRPGGLQPRRAHADAPLRHHAGVLGGALP